MCDQENEEKEESGRMTLKSGAKQKVKFHRKKKEKKPKSVFFPVFVFMQIEFHSSNALSYKLGVSSFLHRANVVVAHYRLPPRFRCLRFERFHFGCYCLRSDCDLRH